MLTVIGSHGREDIRAMSISELVKWVNHCSDLYLSIKGVDPFGGPDA